MNGGIEHTGADSPQHAAAKPTLRERLGFLALCLAALAVLGITLAAVHAVGAGHILAWWLGAACALVALLAWSGRGRA